MSQVEEEHAEKLNYEYHKSSTNFEENKASEYCCAEQRLMHSSNIMAGTEIKSSIQVKQRWKPMTIQILLMIFGISAWIGVNSIFIQLPLLQKILPESQGLAVHLTVIIQAANLAPLLYGLLRKSSFQLSESFCIIIMLGIGSMVMGLMALLYNKTSSIAGKEHSTALFVLTFFIAAVSCTSSVLFMPYLRNFKERYLVSYFIGEGLGGVIPSIVSLIQGIGDSSSSKNNNNSNENFDTATPRFSSQSYFMFIFACLLSSLTAFLLLENLPFIKEEKISRKNSDNKFSDSEAESCHCQEKVSVLLQSSKTEDDGMEKHICMDDYKKTDIEEFSGVHYTQNRKHTELNNLYLFILLSVICLLANGLFPGIQPFSCTSYGDMSYHLSLNFSHIANPTACLLALWYLPRNKKIINWLTFVISIGSCYVLYLAFSSPNSPFKNSKIGQILVVLSWTLLHGFISYLKLIITAVFRRKSEKKLFHVGVVIQVGSACGAVLSFALINYTTLLPLT